MRFQSVLHWFICLLIVGLSSVSQAADRPNVIVVFIDDMGWSDLSCFGGETTQTENIDRLAKEGLRFTQFYVNSPICSPSRVALTTGQYPQRWRISSYLASRQLNHQRGMANWLVTEAPSLPRELKRAGYRVGHFGKWHMGGQRDVGEAPLILAYGFDQSLTNFEGLGPRVLPLKDAYNGKPPERHGLGSENLGQGPIHWKDRSEITTHFVDGAIAFIEQAQQQKKPFYVNVWPDDVHSPFFPPRALRAAAGPGKRAKYYAVLDAMDQQLGKLFDRIRNDPELSANTMIVVASDNGHQPGAGQSLPLRGVKTWLYEGGVRSPLIVWGPGLLAASAVNTTNKKSVFSAIDLNVSLYKIAGVLRPDHDPATPADQVLDGEDVADTLLGKSQAGRRAPLFWRRPPDRKGTTEEPNPDLAVRQGRWKFYVNYDGGQPKLFDLVNDTSETTNVVDDHPDVAAELKRKLFAWNTRLPADAADPRFQRSPGKSELESERSTPY